MPPSSNLLQELSKIFSEIPFNHTLGATLDSLEKDKAVMRFTMKKELIGNYLHGILHGGVISSVLDMVGGMAAIATAVIKHQGRSLDELVDMLGKSSTIDLQVNFLRPGKGEFFTAKAEVLHCGNKITFSRMELHNLH